MGAKFDEDEKKDCLKSLLKSFNPPDSPYDTLEFKISNYEGDK